MLSVAETTRSGNAETNPGVIQTLDLERRLRERGLAPRWEGIPPPGFTGVVTDSREVRPGVLFCALHGTEFDGHAFVTRAAAAGAVAALVDQTQPDADLPQLVVADTRAATAHAASILHGDPAAGLSLVGVTGTNGKTTTALITRHILAAQAPSAALGTLGWFDTTGERHPGRLTTPDPLDLMATLGELRDEGTRFVTMEVSSHALDQRRVASLEFEVAVYTNLTREHLDYHPDLEAYRATKLRLADQVHPQGVCAVNDDDAAWSGEYFAGRRVVRYGLGVSAEVRAAAVRYTVTGSDWDLVTPEGTWPVRLPLLGEFNVHNALAAVATARALGMETEIVADRLATAPQVPGRMEVLCNRSALVLRDYMHTPDAYTRVLETLAGLTDGGLYIVFGCGGDRDRGKRPLMGQIAARYADLALITTDNPRSEDPSDICADITRDMPPGSYRVVLDREQAIDTALRVAGAGDVVVLAGKGHETYQDIAGERIPFDEAAIVRARAAGDSR
jgi:UDP-N-acetylmuramoyl-L-alanyl-D-glutamate--2,6-diaminopimelate ligase